MMRERLVFWLKLSTVPVTVGLWYLVYRAYRRPDDEDEERSRARYFDEEPASAKSSFRVVHVRVPKRAVGAIIGKGGEVIRSLQDVTRARISFIGRDGADAGDEEEILIRGVAKRVDEAERRVRAIIAAVPEMEAEELQLPSRYVGPLIGRNGENIRAMMSRTRTKIDVERTQTAAGDTDRTITVRGTREQIVLALQAIEQLQEEIDERDRRRQGLENSTQPLPETDQPLEVLVSVVKSPSTLFLQLTQSCYALDPLVQQMTRHYYQRPNPRRYEYKPGAIVAGMYEGNWHRARVAGTTDHTVDVDFLDYGDAADLRYDEVRPLTEKAFLTLPFQAIEVRLHGLQPASADEAARDRGSTYLEDITYQSRGVRLIARVIARDGDLPSVHLFDPNREGEDRYDINEMMVRSGHCVRTSAEG